MEIHKIESKTNYGTVIRYFVKTSLGYRRVMFDLDNFFQLNEKQIIKDEIIEINTMTGKMIVSELK